jgi:hypothetical protein
MHGPRNEWRNAFEGKRMSKFNLQLPEKRTSLYPITSKLIKDEWIKLDRGQISPWYFLTSGKEFRVHDYYGKEIVYQ